MKGELKLKAEDNLAPIRNQLRGLVRPNSSVVEFGCGNGNLLFTLSPKIQSGLGIDKSKKLIDEAIKQKKKKRFPNIDFLCKRLGTQNVFSQSYDFSIASLFFHIIPIRESVYLINKMTAISDNVLICGFSSPDTLQQRVLLWADQRFTNHYRNFRTYQKNGYLEGVLKEAKCADYLRLDTHIPFVKIYKIT